MNRTAILIIILLLVFPVLSFAQNGISDDSMQNSAQDSSQESFGQSSQESTDESSANSSENSFRQSSDSSSAETAASSGQGSVDAIIIAGVAVGIGLTVVGVVLLVNVNGVKEEEIVGLQDQIYLAEGKDYDELRNHFQLDDIDVIQANDELVASGYCIEDNQSAADYLAALILKLAQKSDIYQGMEAVM